MKSRLLPIFLTFLVGLPLVPWRTEGASAATPIIRMEPAAGYGWVIPVIQSAKRSVDLSMYELEDSAIESALIAKAKTGVRVRVLLNLDYTGTKANTPAMQAFAGTKVQVHWAPANQIFHAKYLVIDGTSGWIGTGNFTPQYYSSSRDVWVLTTTASQVAAMAGTFQHDFSGAVNQLVRGPNIVWSPGSAPTLVSVINTARHTLWVENEEMKNTTIQSALAAAAHRGVVVHVTMTQSSSWTAALTVLATAGVKVVTHSSSQLYIHAKLICADCSARGGELFLGSENFSTYSLDYNRELGIITTSPAVVGPVFGALTQDAASGTPLTVVHPAPGHSLPVISAPTTVSLGDYPTVTVATSAGATCTLVMTLPSGRVSAASGLGTATADGAGHASWTWHISTRTGPGTGSWTATCPTGTVTRNLVIQ